jgi:serine/threonine protein kinase
MNEETIFATALEKPSDARAAYLAEACGNDEVLRKRLEGLLAASEKVGNFMADPAGAPAIDPARTAALPASADPGAKLTNSDDEPLTFLTPSSRPDSLGRLGHYEVLQVLGRGGFGIVFRAFDETLQRVVALKVMAPQLAATSPARKRFLREARSSAQVRHENVVHVYEVAEQPLPYLAMEFIPGETLQQKLDRSGPLDVPEVLRIGRQIAEGLAAAHACDLIHRDIKPGNILLEGGQHKVKITDFGLARAADDASISQSGIIAGTPMYMAPEQAQGQTLDQRADLFSLGSVLYQMVAGRPPFRANTTVAVLKRVAEDTPRPIREIIPETPQWLCDIIAKLHAKDPDDRYQSAREVADVLADCEAQLKANAKLKDFSRIPRRADPVNHWVMLGVIGCIYAIALFLPAYKPYVASAGNQTFSVWSSFAANAYVRQPWLVNCVFWVACVFFSFRRWLLAAVVTQAAVLFTFFAFSDGHEELLVGHWIWLTSIELLAGCGLYEFIMHLRGGAGQKATYGTEQPAHLKDYSRIPRSKPQPSGRRKWVAAAAFGGLAALILLPVIVMVVMHLLLERPEAFDPSKPESYRKRKPETKQSAPESEGWVQLFNGKDLSGWKTHPDQPGQWKVKDGLLIGNAVQSYLYSEGNHFADFQLRIEARINNGGDSGIFLRTPFAMRPGQGTDLRPAGGYEVELQENPTYLVKTGSVWDAGTSGAPKSLWINNQAPLTRPDEWFTLEIVAQGNHFVTKVNGTQTADCFDPLNHFTSGHVALQVFSPLTIVQFRKIEIKELPASWSPPPAIAPFADADVQRIAALPAAQQVEEVRRELKRRNPGFDGKMETKIEGGIVTEFRIVTDKVTDVAPIRDFDALRVLDCSGTWTDKSNGVLADLTPLKGMNLAALTSLKLSNTQVGDTGMVYFKGCKNLTVLYLNSTQVTDAGLADFRDCKNLTELWVQDTQVGSAGMVHFQDCKALASLNLADTKVSNAGLAHFKDCKNLKRLYLDGTQVDDAGLSQFKDMPLRRLAIDRTGITDLTLLQSVPLDYITLTPKNITRGLDILRDMKSLKTIGISWRQSWPAAEFWQRYDKGEFTK